MLSKTTSSGETAFPWKLHMVLEQSTFDGFDDIISWIGNSAFKVHDPIQFEESIMQRFFNQTQYKSFQRQLNIYGFQRVKTAGKATGSYTHPLFIRGNPDACAFMVRVKVKKKGIRKNLSRNTSIGSTRSRNDSIDSQEGVTTNKTSYTFHTPYPLHRRFVSNNEPVANCGASNAMFEPTPLIQVSASAVTMIKNETIEPTPFRIDSMGSSRRCPATGATTPISNHDVVLCDRLSYISNDDSGRSMESSIAKGMQRYPSIHQPQMQAPQPHYLKRRHSQVSSVDLDLDTIFDDDNSSNNYYNKFNKHVDNAETSSFNPFEMHNAFFTSKFRTPDEQSVPAAVQNRMVGIGNY
eukprot:CAMPEP_0197277696 /NCGR_PEP_ID=MMETSP1432-20130617/17452_1 /TAXON_ID=44447 /ORGANISM="Pseudo-nitzschia delicatissima, Strain UNC1205" /LENGTH=351 /DNA_ID=CAMNT_0042743943 /DNA_START=6 /DNA_END=1061 /DNA_ORIENTATION=-